MAAENRSIEIAHGHGGQKSLELVQDIILPALGSSGAPTLDAARLSGRGEGELIFSTDSFTVSPYFFPGGDIGKLSVCGTVNDLAMAGGEALCLSLALILEEGFPLEHLERVMASAGKAARDARAPVVCGDTKVVERGKGDGVYINTAGIGRAVSAAPLAPDRIAAGDRLIVSGAIGDHGAAIMAARNDIPMGRALESDCACLWPLAREIMRAAGDSLHAMRDPSRGGLSATLNEFALDANVEILVREEAVPIKPEVREFLDALGMDPLILANEGKLIAFVAPDRADAALQAIKASPLGLDAAEIGEVATRRERGRVVLQTPFGTRRVLDMPVAEGLPRIC